MPDYRPIPGQMDRGPSSPMNLPVDDLSRMASEKASNLLTPYGDQFGNRPIVPPSPGVSPGPGTPPGPGSSSMEDKLYQSIHPDTFSKVLEMIMQFVTGKPIPKYQEGTDYVPETGPAMLHQGEKVVPAEENIPFRPGVPGEPVGEPSPMGSKLLTYAGGQGLGYESLPERGLRGARETVDKISPYIGPALSVPLKALSKASEFYSVPQPGGQGGRVPPYAGPRPWKNAIDLKKDEGGAYAIPEWKDYAPEGEQTGIRYKLGPENVRGDELARQGILSEAGRAEEKYGIPRYYQEVADARRQQAESDAYYADRQLKEAAGIVPRTGMAEYEYNAAGMRMTPEQRLERTKSEGEARKQYIASTGATDIARLEHGPGSPLSQERLAHAESLRATPEMNLAGISEQSRAHLEGISRTVAGHLEAAKIAAEPKDLMMKEINTTLTQGQKNQDLYGTPFDPQKITGTIMRIYKAFGKITDAEWAKMPEDYKREPMKKPPFAEFYKTFQNDPRFKGKSKSELAKTYNTWNP